MVFEVNNLRSKSGYFRALEDVARIETGFSLLEKGKPVVDFPLYLDAYVKLMQQMAARNKGPIEPSLRKIHQQLSQKLQCLEKRVFTISAHIGREPISRVANNINLDGRRYSSIASPYDGQYVDASFHTIVPESMKYAAGVCVALWVIYSLLPSHVVNNQGDQFNHNSGVINNAVILKDMKDAANDPIDVSDGKPTVQDQNTGPEDDIWGSQDGCQCLEVLSDLKNNRGWEISGYIPQSFIDMLNYMPMIGGISIAFLVVKTWHSFLTSLARRTASLGTLFVAYQWLLPLMVKKAEQSYLETKCSSIFDSSSCAIKKSSVFVLENINTIVEWYFSVVMIRLFVAIHCPPDWMTSWISRKADEFLKNLPMVQGLWRGASKIAHLFSV